MSEHHPTAASLFASKTMSLINELEACIRDSPRLSAPAVKPETSILAPSLHEGLTDDSNDFKSDSFEQEIAEIFGEF